jgi:hypothetical protein
MKNEEFDQLAFARRIRRAGRPIHIPEDDGETRSIPSDALRVRQTGGIIESSAFDWGAGTGFKIHLVVTSNISGFAVSYIELEVPWKQTYFHWLEDPVVIDGPSRCYRFVGNGSLEFKRELVINHRLEVTRPFSAGESAKGFLLGFGYDPIPEKFSQGQMIPAFLILYDQFSCPYRVPIELWADRTTRNLRPRRSSVRRKGGLLDKRDPIAGLVESLPGRARLPHAQSARAAIARSEGPAAFLAPRAVHLPCSLAQTWSPLLERWGKSPVTAGIAGVKFLHRIRLDEAETVEESVG